MSSSTQHVAVIVVGIMLCTNACAFPFYMDIGGLPDNASSLSPTVPNVEFGQIFECPHPCGLVPHFDTDGNEVNGGIPQNVNMTLHLSILKTTFDRYVPFDESRFMDFDFEAWNPIWERNPNNSHVRLASVKRVQSRHPTWSDPSQIENAAKGEFEAAAQTVLAETMSYMRRIRPALRVGMYGYPTRFYYNGYNTSQGEILREQNDNLFPLWCSMDAIMPSVYQFYDSCNRSDIRANNEMYVRSNVREAVRISEEARGRCSAGTRPPVLVYTWHRYHDGEHFVCDQDESMTWNISVEEGADAVVLWGYEKGQSEAFEAYWTHDFAPMALAWSPPSRRKR